MFSIIRTAELKRLRERLVHYPSRMSDMVQEHNDLISELEAIKDALQAVGLIPERETVRIGSYQLAGETIITKTAERRLKEWCIEMAFKSPGACMGTAYREAEWIYDWITGANKDTPQKDAA